MQSGHEVERHVDPGRDAGGGDDAAAVHESIVGAYLDAGAQSLQVME